MANKKAKTNPHQRNYPVDDYSSFLSKNDARIKALKKLLKELEEAPNKPKSQNR
ncbi:hypothetical protein KEM09_02040 [Carboxylicivirga mesophila]|uniref:Uncharacterized protein n=1 Tax=Carboxylicivirga mesophila TaxID=1166478 RepID=A0ABS5K599_9BACT|nr:hypothetical protein [Carboxylicivirga mesophila]MBS2210160.1 hypothetical protein [Carboxylicivirga mesophila]